MGEWVRVLPTKSVQFMVAYSYSPREQEEEEGSRLLAVDGLSLMVVHIVCSPGETGVWTHVAVAGMSGQPLRPGMSGSTHTHSTHTQRQRNGWKKPLPVGEPPHPSV